jgi:hypothetical protein
MGQDKNQSGADRVARPVTAGVGGLLVVILRVLPLPPNLAPAGGLGVFGGARLRLWQALALVLGVMAVSDLLLLMWQEKAGFDPLVYASMLLYVLIGRAVCRNGAAWRAGVASVLGSCQFYLLTNFSAWLQLSAAPVNFYPRSAAGLIQAYLLGLPFAGKDVPAPLGFFGNTVLSDLCTCYALFALCAVVAWCVRTTREVPAEGSITAAP